MHWSRAGKRQWWKTIHGDETIEGHLAARAVLIGGLGVRHCVLGHALRHFGAISRPNHLTLRNSRLCCHLDEQSEAEANQGQDTNEFHTEAIV